MTATHTEPLRVAQALRGKTIFLIGGTGFLGKVYLYLLLARHADLERIYLMIRRKQGVDPFARLWSDVFESPVFDPLRDRMGVEAFQDFIKEKVVAIPGDLTAPSLGVDPATRERLTGHVDVVVNSSGLVDFNPSLEEGLEINTIGIQRALDLTVEIGARYMAISTCYVAGNRSGTIFEDEPIHGYFPRKDEMPGVTFDPRREIEEGLQLVARVRAEAEHQEHQNEFIHKARKRLQDDHRNPDDEAALAKELSRVREKWISRRLSEDGERRAATFGWANTYTYTKSLGEQLVVSTPGLIYSIVRPAIIESSIQQPFPGWNEGINTTAPLIFMSLQGQLNYPSQYDLILDVIPVDYIAGPMVAVTAALIEGRHKPVYQLGSSDSNPMNMKRIVELTGLYKRKYYTQRSRGNPLLNDIYARFEPRATTHLKYQAWSTPMITRVASLTAKAIEEVGGDKVPVLSQLKTGAKMLERRGQTAGKLIDVFLPFIVHNKYRFKTDNIRALYAQMAPEDRAAIPFEPETMDWMHYWLYVHVVGLEKWVFPKIKERLRKKPLPEVYRYEDLLELFDAATANHSDRVALRYRRSGGEDTFTYAQLRERAGWVATFLATHGVEPGDRVLLVCENRPEWAMLYFGILQIGASAVPVDAKFGAREISNLATSSGAKGILCSPNVAATVGPELEQSIPLVPRWTFEEALTQAEGVAFPLVPRTQKGQIASLIFTSGTTGTPKGVMLSHRNLTALLEMLAKIFRLTHRDRLVSVLPLHHTFEFTAGFLLPLSRGASITHLEEVNGETLLSAMRAQKATALVGVPALWELIHRKLKARVEEKGALAEALFIGLTTLHGALRQRLGINLGKTLFGAVHSNFGGRVRYLISGAASLSPEVFDSFDALGFDLYEGYGLTEASPVLAANRPGHRPVRGSVGVPLPGVEIKIHDPDASGIGEIIARGPNVMEGYFQNREATDGVIKNGWLHTGDMGRFDKNGNLYILGRAKEVIVDASGKNVYPDEVETLYAGCPYFKELCVVGVSDGRGSEQVAALAVIDEDRMRDDALTLDQVKERIDLHMKHIAMGLPHHQRIKILRFKDGELPRTATRKIKRRDVVRLMEGMLKGEAAGKVLPGAPSGGTLGHLQAMIARVTGKPAEAISPSAKLDSELGLDSLMATELLGALEEQGLPALELTDLIEAGTVEGVAELIRSRAQSLPASGTLALAPRKASAAVVSPRKMKEIFEVNLKRVHEIQVPELVRAPVKRLLAVGQREAYHTGFSVKVKGQAFVPMDRNVLVISNHTSHLDMGLVKYALGTYGKGLVSLAAADYFFADGPMRFYFENFTNAVPLDRVNPRHESIRRAQTMLEQGHNLLLFPEGTRSPGGSIQPFKRGVGMMALRFGVDVLPVYLHGTSRALPKGSLFPRSRDLEVHIGAPVRYADMVRLTRGMSSLQAQTLIAQLLQRAVESLRDHEIFDIEQALHKEPAAHPLEVLFGDLVTRFRPDRLEEPITYYITLGPGELDKWTLSASRQGATARPGKGETPADCVLKTTPDVFTRIVREAYVPSVAEFMSGEIKTNDLGKLQKLSDLFEFGGG